MPPSVLRLCVAGSGPNVRPCLPAAFRSSSSTMPGSHARILLLRIQLHDAVHVLREVEQNGDIHRLPGNARAAAACDDRRAVPAAHRERVHHIVGILRQHDADRDHAVVAGVGGIHSAIAVAEPDLAFDAGPQLVFERRPHRASAWRSCRSAAGRRCGSAGSSS